MSLERSFKDLTDRGLAALMQGAVPRAFASGDLALEQRAAVDILMVVTGGMLRFIHVDTGRGLSEFVGALGADKVVVEMSLFDVVDVSVMLIASGDTQVQVIPRRAIDALTAADLTFAGRVDLDHFLHLARRLRGTNHWADPGPGAAK